MPLNLSEISNKSNNFDLNNINLAFSSTSSITPLTLTDVDTTNFTIAANTSTNLDYYLSQEICLFDALYFQKRESNILIINYNKVLIWDENVNKFKIVDIKNFDYNLVETNEKYDSTSDNITFNGDFINSAQIFLTLSLEQNDVIFIDTEKNKNYKFCSKIKKWILLDNKSFFNVEFDNNITVFDIQRNNNIKELLIEKKGKIKFYEGFVFSPYITSPYITTTANTTIATDATIYTNTTIATDTTIYNNYNLNNRIYSRYAIGIDTANNNYLTTSLGHS